ncbi:MAG: hypothetical protein K1X88_18740 [Nannocystaceae bacterium]|nr:hypothetical protein [Nannocystaceae bacterium]
MRIPHTAIVSLTVTVPFRCTACGCRASVQITDKGLSAVGHPRWFAKAGEPEALVEAAYERARTRARKSARVSAASLPCPHCHHRSGVARLRFALSLVLPWLLGAAIATTLTAAGLEPWQPWYERALYGAMALGAVAAAIAAVISIRRDLARAHASARLQDIERPAG